MAMLRPPQLLAGTHDFLARCAAENGAAGGVDGHDAYVADDAVIRMGEDDGNDPKPRVGQPQSPRPAHGIHRWIVKQNVFAGGSHRRRSANSATVQWLFRHATTSNPLTHGYYQRSPSASQEQGSAATFTDSAAATATSRHRAALWWP